MHAVNIIIGAVLAAGFDGAEATLVYRAVADFSLYWAGCEASFLAMDEQLQKNDRSAWGAYLTVDRADHPNIWQVRTELPEVRDDDIFETILSFVIAGLIARAPGPCRCARHPGGGAAAQQPAPCGLGGSGSVRGGELGFAVGGEYVHVFLAGELTDGGHHLVGDLTAGLAGGRVEQVGGDGQRLADLDFDAAGARDHAAGGQDLAGAG
jgi:hypothetical protein